ncbi:hypothetical protein P7H59_07430 [Enterococcus viikkiensis]|uniref:Uncharacterized protein n=1 Tax=Enterococcus viikkiensis TaxID=930854 RepID=A0ABU3FQP3_9ENTE|nr:hypothetical protein [Enterococcus viikkiensis]MDT2828291.1 hypothetical protein [Enterococcus viikkiensis]
MRTNGLKKFNENDSSLKDKKAKVLMYVQQLKYIFREDNLLKLSKEEQINALEKVALRTNAFRYALIIHDKDKMNRLH